jgi:hypothetical protein
MPALRFFADDQDLPTLLHHLNADPDIAFIVSDGPNRAAELRRWKAVRSVATLPDGHHSLWHVPGGPLPLAPARCSGGMTRTGWQNLPTIPNPWAGWIEQRPGAIETQPFFCNGLSEIRLDLWTRHRPYSQHERTTLPMLNGYWIRSDDYLVVSDFQWIGSHFGPIGLPAPAQTHDWWNRLRQWFRRTAVRITDGRRRGTVFWAFPSALEKLKDGMEYYAFNFNLDASIRSAR